MAEFYHLLNRSNLSVFEYPDSLRRDDDDRRIIVYDDHRTILNVLYVAMQERLFADAEPNVVTFDRHDDAVLLSPKQKQQAKSVRKSCFSQRNDKKMWKFTEFNLSGLDDDWVRAGMELGLINNYIGFGHKKQDAVNISGGYESYRTLDKKVHRLYSNGHLDWEIGSRGVIGDNHYQLLEKQNAILNDIQFHNGRFDNTPITPFVFDVDLDCFTDEFEDYRMAWPDDIFVEHYQVNPVVSGFVRSLLARSSLITICREPDCCGGLGESNRILELLDYYWFDGVLKTRRIV